MPRIEVYSDGCDLRLSWIIRRQSTDETSWHDIINSSGGAGYEKHASKLGQPLRWGIELDDGSRLLDVDQPPWDPDKPDAVGRRATLNHDHGGGSSTRYEMSAGIWLWPLPQGHSFRFVAAWGAFGVPESSVTVDSIRIREAASRVGRLWP